MILYRLSKARYKNDLSGRGAEIAGGRWNGKGTAVVYTCESIALCNVEVAVRIPLGIIPSDYHLIHIELPAKCNIKTLKAKELPHDWNSYPHSHSTQAIGDAFISGMKALVLKVPSAAVQGTFNYLINPFHKDMNLVKVIKTQEYSFDKRLFVR